MKTTKYNTPIHAVGDSHAMFFSGYDKIQPNWPEKSNNRLPHFAAYRLGAVLAYNLCEYKTKMKGREKLFLLLKQIPKKDTILLCFGEIDCRVHLLKQAKIQNKDIYATTKECVGRYFQVIQEIKNKGYNIAIWNAPPSSPNQTENPEYPQYGSCKERNDVTMIFNSLLGELLEKEKIPFISIFNKLINKKGITRSEYLMDGVHLSQAAMSYAINEINKNLNLSIPIPKNILHLATGYVKIVKNKLFMLKKIIKKILRRNRHLSQFNELGFHGDKHLIDIASHSLSNAAQFIETGSNVGSTLYFVAKNFPNIKAYSCEPDKAAFEFTAKKIAEFKNVKLSQQLSPEMIYDITRKDPSILEKTTVFWLDAHEYGYKWPLKEEIAYITNNFKNGFIFIDDFKNPHHSEFAFSKYDDQTCEYEYIADAINKKINYEVYYPNYTTKTSPHHPLTGWGIIVFGNNDFYTQLPEELKQIIIKK